MLKKRKKILLSITSAIFATTLFALGFSFFSKSVAVQAEDYDFQVSLSKTEYDRNEIISIPEGKVIIGGNEYEAESELLYPDGRKNVNSSAILDVSGEYTLRYTATVDSVLYQKEYPLEVYSTPSSLFISDANSMVTGNVTSPDYYHTWAMQYNKADYNGVELSFTENGATVEYENIINLNELSQADKLLQFLIIPTTVGVSDMRGMKITLTDVYDPSKFVHFYITDGGNISYPHWCVPTAVYDNNGIVYTNRTYYNANRRTASTFRGPIVGNGSQNAPFSLHYDAGTGTFYSWLKSFTNNDYNVVCTKDEMEAAMGGFTTGEVRLSITADSLNQPKSQILVTQVDGNLMNGERVSLDDKLQIAVNYQGYDPNNLPYGVKGENNTYPIFEVKAWSMTDGMVEEPNVNVYYSAFRKGVPIYDDCFPIKKSGKYYIVYTFNSLVSGSKQYEIEILVKDSYDSNDEIVLEFSEQMISEAKQADIVFLYDPILSGGIGNGTLVKAVTINGREVAIEKEGINDFFVAEQSGEYTIKYVYTDIIGTSVEKMTTVTVTADEYRCANTPTIPYGIKLGESHQFNALTALKYNSASKNYDTEYICDIYVGDEKLVDGVYTPTSAGNKTVIYKVGENVVYQQNFEVKEIPSGLGFLSSYFTTKNLVLATSTGNEALSYKFSQGTEGELAFINKVFLEDFSTSFFNNGRFKAITLVLTDSVDKSQEVEIKLVKIGEEYYICLNGNEYTQIEEKNIGAQSNPFSISIDEGKNVVFDNTGDTLGVLKTTTADRSFIGFNSDFVYVKYIIEGMSDTVFTLDKICGQYFLMSNSRDITPAQIYFQEKVSSVASVRVNEIVVIPQIYVIYDVLSNNMVCTVKITAPDGTDVYNDDYKDNISFTAIQFGSYKVQYTYHDGIRTNKMTYDYTVIVSERNAPVISLSSHGMQTAKVGATYNIVSYSVKDDTTAEKDLKVIVMVIEPITAARWLVNGDSYVFEKAGVYTIRVVAYDSFYNEAVVEYTVTVS